MTALTKNKRLAFILLAALIASANFFIYRLSFLSDVPQQVVIGSLIDFVIVIPLLFYVFFLRKRYSIKYALVAAAAGYGAAVLIIPGESLSHYSDVKYIVLAAEAAFISIELLLIGKLLVRLPAVISHYRSDSSPDGAFQYRLLRAMQANMKPSRLLDVIASEISLIHYSLFSWKSRPAAGLQGARFTYHKKTSAIVIYVMLIHSLVLESIVFHFLLFNWNEIVAAVALILNVYTLLYLLAEIQAIRKCPFLLTDEKLYLRIGLSKGLVVPLDAVKSFHRYEGPEKRTNANLKHIFDAAVPDIAGEKPAFEIEFHYPLEARLMYGFKKKVLKAHLRPDDPAAFLSALQPRLQERLPDLER